MTKNIRAELPVQKNQTIELVIDDIASQGQGVGHIQGYALFVEGGLPGERVRVTVIKATRGYGVGKLLEVLSPCEHRVQPVCTVASRCGGCQLMHVDYAEQLAFKRRRVQESLHRLGKLEQVTVRPTLPSPQQLRYRNKGAFAAGTDADGSLVFGLYAPRSHRLIPVQNCALQQPVCASAIYAVQQWAKECKVSAYNEATGRGLIRHLVVRTNREGGCMVSLVATQKLPRPELLVTLLCARVEGLRGVYAFLHDSPGNVILEGAMTTLWGEESLPETIGDLAFDISPRSFFQVNVEQSEILYTLALDAAGVQAGMSVVDAYCGIGTLALLAAKRGAQVVGIECVPEAVEDAMRNAQRGGLEERTTFMLGEVEDILPDVLRRHAPQVLILDPPRKGCDARAIQAIQDNPVGKLVYVSCDPGTLARDVGLLTQAGYILEWAQPVDMFPQTAHVECLVLMSRVKD